MKMEVQTNYSSKTNIEKLSTTLAAAASPPSSSSSSPAHEFSFTISFHQQQQQPSTNITTNNNSNLLTTSPVAAAALDLSPADDIFFHGHLLPLHLLSHLPISPRTSTNSLDSFTLPIIESYIDDHDHVIEGNYEEEEEDDIIEYTNFQELNDDITTSTSTTTTPISRVKSKSFSIFGWRKGNHERVVQEQERPKKKSKFEVSDVVKKYMRLVRPLLAFGGSRKSSINNLQSHHNQSYSFPGSVNSRGKLQNEYRGRRGMFSAPASMRTSPTNSGLLLATGAAAGCSSTSESTMEELQAAIQAAITHCKNSIAAQDNNIKHQDD